MPNPPSLRAEIVTRRSYNRPLNADGTLFETWEQTVARVIRHQRWLWERAKRSDLNQQEEAELAQLHQIQLSRAGSLAGRTLWLGGTEISKTRETSNFNCSGLRVKTVFDVVDIAWLLLQGCGCGFMPVTGVLNGFCRPIPTIEIIRSQRTERGGAENNTETWLHDSKTWIIQVGDSAVAWAKAIGKLIAGKYPAQKLTIDLSQIRPSGQRLRGYGWISSGDEQLSRALAGIVEVLNHAPARLLTAIEIMDIINWIGTILSSRRSAELAMLPSDHPQAFQFATAKRNHFHENPQRAQSNNSLVYYNKPSKAELRGFFDLMLESGGSEPGLINGETALQRAPDFAILNPCVIGETPILTVNGYRPIQETVGETIQVWNGEEWSFVTPFSTGVNPILHVELSDGSELFCTPNHKWLIQRGASTQAGHEERIETQHLKVGDKLYKYEMPVVRQGVDVDIDAYSQGFYSGDGLRNSTYSMVYEPKYPSIPRLVGKFYPPRDKMIRWHHDKMLEKNFVPVNGTLDYCLDWLAGVLDSDGSITRNPNSTGLQIASVDQSFLKDIRLMLTRLGCTAKVCSLHDAGFKSMPDGRGDVKDYFCQESFRLIVNACDTTKLLELGLKCERLKFDYTKPQRNACRFVTIVSVTPMPEVETFCFTEPKANRGTFNGIVTGQCSEVLLGDKSHCNLSEINLSRFNGRFDELCRVIQIIARANYRQTCVDLRDGVLQQTWHELNQYLHLCGVGLTGFVQWEGQNSPEKLQELYRCVRLGTDSMAEALDMPYAKRVTTCKPSGTLSKIMDCTEGVHKPLGKFIFNNINFSKHDPIVHALQVANYHTFENPYDPTGVVARLPVCWDNVDFDSMNGRPVNIESAVTQLERYRMLMENYVDQNVSITVSYDPSEIPAMVDWIDAHWENYVATAFLLRNDPTKTAADLGYPYLPQEVVTQDTYDAYVQTLRPVNLHGTDSLLEMESQECAGGHCPMR